MLLAVLVARPRIHQLFIGPLLFLLGLLPVIGFGQHRLFRAAPLEDFPRGNIQDVLQDKDGFLWIATSDGLGKFDGHQLIDYRHLPYDTNSLSHNYITRLNEDREGNILIGTRRGLSVYLKAEDRFKRLGRTTEALNAGTSDIVLDVMQDRRGWYWFGTYQGLYRRKGLHAPVEQILPNKELIEQLPHKTVWRIHEDAKGRLWIGSGMGLIIADSSARSFSIITHEQADQHGFRALQAWDFSELTDGTLFIGSENGVFRAEEQDSNFYFQHVYADAMSERFVNYMYNDGDSILWVGSHRQGLNEIDLQTGQVRIYQHQVQDNSSLANNNVTSILRDRNGLLWVGSAGFLQFSSRRLNNFKSITTSGEAGRSLSNDIVKSTLVDRSGTLWVGTYSGLNRISSSGDDTSDYQIEHYTAAAQQSKFRISHNNIFGMQEDSRGFLWVASFRGLNYIDLNAPREQQRFQFFTDLDGLPHYYIYDLREIRPGQYWVATYGKLARMYFNPEAPEETSFDWFSHNEPREGNIVNSTVYTMEKDRFGRWWFATFDGLSQHRQQDGRDFFDNYQHLEEDTTSLSDNSIRCLFLDSKDRFWVGTRTGLNLVVQEKATDRASFRHFGMREGFPNDVIQFIEEDNNGMLWVGTFAGLVVFDPDAAIAGETAVRRVYTTADGLNASSMVFRSSFKGSSGQIYCGSAAGLNYFHPAHLLSADIPGQVTLTRLKVNESIIRPSGASDAILSGPVQAQERISLSHWQNQLELSFSVMDFYAPENHQYAYRLLGFHDNWLGGKGVFQAQYTRLPPGQYRFQVKAATSQGLWTEQIRELTIIIRPPWWKTTLAYVIYGLWIALASWWLAQGYIRRKTQALAQQFAIENARQEERIRLRQKNAADFHDELGHRLTKISLFLELAKRNIRQPQELFAHFQKIKQHVDGLSSGMRDLIWALDPSKDNLLQAMMRLRDFGDQLFDATPTQFKVKGLDLELEGIQLQPNVRQQLLLLFKEAMHNCLKYAEATETQLQIEMGEQDFTVTFQDNGRGFTRNEKPKSGYGLRNMQDRAEKLGGQLRIETAPASGTKIQLSEIPHLG